MREIEFTDGDILTVKAHTSDPGKGLTYGGMEVIAGESGKSGGWDVYDGTRADNGHEVSFYGFSVERKG